MGQKSAFARTDQGEIKQKRHQDKGLGQKDLALKTREGS
jgi:hypothetical protein